jgi:NDP-sugar pyrophosphorylase family protein
MKTDSLVKLKEKLKDSSPDLLSVVDKQYEVDSVVLNPENMIEEQDIPVIIMAGGLGTRLGELTKKCPKSMLDVGGKPILETIICNLKKEGFRNFFITVNYRSEQIIDYFGLGETLDVKINYVKEYKRMGTAGSLSLLQQAVKGPMVVMNGDILTKTNLKEVLYFHLATNSDATMCVQEMEYSVPFGVVDVDDTRVINISEKPTEKKIVNTGMYVLNGELLKMIPEDTFYDMTTLLQSLLSEHKVSVFRTSDYWIDIGRKQDFQQANRDYGEIF